MSNKAHEPGLDWFGVERVILAPNESKAARARVIAQWPRLVDWQQKGLVKIRWDGEVCYVALTNAGRARVKT